MDEVEYATCEKCKNCESTNIEWIKLNEMHGNWYHCNNCSRGFWGGKLKNEEQNKKRLHILLLLNLESSFVKFASVTKNY